MKGWVPRLALRERLFKVIWKWPIGSINSRLRKQEKNLKKSLTLTVALRTLFCLKTC